MGSDTFQNPPPQKSGQVDVSDLLARLKQYGASFHVPLDLDQAGTKVNWTSLLDSTLDAQKLKVANELRQDFDRRYLELHQQLQQERAEKERLQQSIREWERWNSQVNTERNTKDAEILRLRSDVAGLSAELSIVKSDRDEKVREVGSHREKDAMRNVFDGIGRLLK